MEKPVDVRGFGFKLDGGRTQDRPIYIAAIEEGLSKRVDLSMETISSLFR